MLTTGIILTVVNIIITTSIMINVLKIFEKTKPASLRIGLFKMFNNSIVAFVINLVISNMIGYFTGQGMVAGMANLLSSVLVGIFLPMYTKDKYAHCMIMPPKRKKEKKAKTANTAKA